MTPHVPRAYQRKLINTVRTTIHHGKHPLVMAPTGSGKMFMLATLSQDVHWPVLIVEHRQELVNQAVEELQRLGESPGVLAAFRKNPNPDSLIQVGMIQTISRRGLGAFKPKIIVVDECHLSQASSYRKLMNDFPDAHRIGWTGTPERLDGKGFKPYFDELILGPDFQELVDLGFLAPVTLRTTKHPLNKIKMRGHDFDQDALDAQFNTTRLVGDTVDGWCKEAQGRSSIVFTTSIKHSQNLTEQFLKRGVRAAHLDGITPDDERGEIVSRMRDGTLDVVCNYGILVEGVDIRNVSGIVLAMATMSLTKYLQTIGRGTRVCDGKTDLLVQDRGGNYHIHGHPAAKRKWSLDGRPRRMLGNAPPDVAEYEADESEDAQEPVEVSRKRWFVQEDGELVEAEDSGWAPEKKHRELRTPAPRLAPVPRPELVPPAVAPSGLKGDERPCPVWASSVRDVWYAAERTRLDKHLSVTWPVVQCRMALLRRARTA